MMKDINAMQNMIQDQDLTDIINSIESILKIAPAITKTLTTRKNQSLVNRRSQIPKEAT